MSYHQGHLYPLPPGPAPAPAPRQAPYPMYPLAAPPPPLLQPLPPPQTKTLDPMVKALVVVVVIAVLLYVADRMTEGKPEPVKPNPGKKMSTRDMAKKLFDRLERNGTKVNDTTMRSLAQLGRRK
jgi:hypothetical protein